MNEFSQTPDLPASLEWINCQPQNLNSMRGRVVALVFWHAGSVTSANLLTDMAQLLMRYADGLRVIGIHVPRFEAQRNPDLVARAVNCLALRFPIVNDSDAVAWQHYGIRAWPSVALIDYEGRLVEIIAGDRQREVIERRVVAMLEEAGERGLRVYQIAEPAYRPETIGEVAYPRGLALGPERLYVSDSGHNRVLECTLEGRILRAFGSGSPGFVDGMGVQSAFRLPLGLALRKNILYVADTGNHAIRRIDLGTGKVDTLVARNQNDVVHAEPIVRMAPELLDRPYDIVSGPDRLYVAMTGANQIWQLDPGGRSFTWLAGNGKSGSDDGPAAQASFSQPIGLALAGGSTLHVSDSLTSALRSLRLDSGEVRTLSAPIDPAAGAARPGEAEVRLQFPADITIDPGSGVLWVADCYNDAIGLMHLDSGALMHLPLAHPLKRPSAVASDGRSLWIANTDAHEVLRLDLSTHQVQVLPMTT